MKPLLVVTPTLGTSPWLEETVASVASCGGQHVLVAAPEHVESLRRRFHDVLVVPEPGGGMYAAINAGLAATHDWGAFTYLNDDDLLLPAFRAVVARLARVGEVACVLYGGVRLIDREGRRLGAIPVCPWPALNRLLYAQRIEPVYQHGTVITRAAYACLGGFDASFRFCGDSEFLARACVGGVPFVRATRREIAAFRLRPGQATKDRERMNDERTRVDAMHRLLEPHPGLAHRLARITFRLANVPAYAERVARHGWVSFDDLLSRAG